MVGQLAGLKSSRFAKTALYWLLLCLAGGFVLIVFVRPVSRHWGINKFHTLNTFIDGTMHRPYVYRTLFPTTVRIITSIIPEIAQQRITSWVEKHAKVRNLFILMEWDAKPACRIFVVVGMMYLMFVAFAHVLCKFAMFTCRIDNTFLNRLLISLAALGGLVPFFVKMAYIYDPPQILLFTLALYFLSINRIRNFLFVFALCCWNKETCLLLIPIFAITFRKKLPEIHYRLIVAALCAYFVIIKGLLTYLFAGNPGSFAYNVFKINLLTIADCWSFAQLALVIFFSGLLFYKWNSKPRFLRTSFLWISIPLIILTLFMGLIDEWRDYLEAYPVAFCLAIDTLKRVFFQPRNNNGVIAENAAP
jgi:hypothetical protein